MTHQRPHTLLKFTGGLLLGACAFLLVGCQTNGSYFAANTRISQNPETYSKLSSSQKKAAKEGNLTRGMSKDAVRLAWGKPDSIEKKGKAEQWIYYRREQVDYDSEGPRAENFTQYFSSSEKYYDGYSAGGGVRTVQRLDRTVLFEGGKAVSWTRARH